MRRKTRTTIVLGSLFAALLAGGCGKRSVLMAEDSGQRNLARGNYDTAAADFQEALDQSPGRFESRLGMGKALLALGKPREAREQLEVAHTLRPESGEAIDLLAEAMHGAGEFNAMTRYLRELAEQRQGVMDWVRLGKWTARIGDADSAERALITAARIDRGQTVEPQFELARFYAAIGDDDRAMRRLRMALYIDPADQRVRDMIRELGATPGPTFAMPPVERE